MRAHPSPMFLVITIIPFTKWGIDYTTCNPPSARGNHYIMIAVDYFTKWGIDYTTCNPASARGNCYIIIAVDYFIKWVEVMPMFKDDGETATLFLFKKIIARFDVPKEIFTEHGSHF
jgi:hypothetical protein